MAMNMYTITKYTDAHRSIWNAFIDRSVNGCFLHRREFMEYHQDRFSDHSLMFFKDDQLVACLPAHVANDVCYSHRGLTFASVIAPAKTDCLSSLLQLLEQYALQQQWCAIELKLPPETFHPDEQLHKYALSQAGYKCNNSLTDLVVNFKEPWRPSSKKTAGYRNGNFAAIQLKSTNDLEQFWNTILIPQLQARHNTKPVHTLEEITGLKSNFTEQIQLQVAFYKGQLVAGLLSFHFDHWTKIQYAVANQQGFQCKAMEYLYLETIKGARELGKTGVDLGTVNNPDGTINKGLKRFKIECGARPVPQDTFMKIINL